jgi:uracil-DNA glycosylase
MKRTIFIGQAMPRYKESPHDWKSLNLWLYSIGITDDHIKKYFYYSALVNYFPGIKGGSHKVPTKDEIAKDRKRLKKTVADFDPEVVVPVGRLSISYCLGTKFGTLSDVLGKVYTSDPYRFLNVEKLVIPLPHPSGASTWKYQKENQIILANSLKLLKNHLFR